MDLDGLAGYLMQEANLEMALRFYDAAAATFEKLARMPGMGERRESANPRLDGLRVWRIDGFPESPHLLPAHRRRHRRRPRAAWSTRHR